MPRIAAPQWHFVLSSIKSPSWWKIKARSILQSTHSTHCNLLCLRWRVAPITISGRNSHLATKWLAQIVWAGIQYFVQDCMSAQRRIRSACAGWSESLLCARGRFGSLATHKAPSEDSDQPVRMRRLIWVFSGRTACNLIGNAVPRLIWYTDWLVSGATALLFLWSMQLWQIKRRTRVPELIRDTDYCALLKDMFHTPNQT